MSFLFFRFRDILSLTKKNKTPQQEGIMKTLYLLARLVKAFYTMPLAVFTLTHPRIAGRLPEEGQECRAVSPGL